MTHAPPLEVYAPLVRSNANRLKASESKPSSNLTKGLSENTESPASASQFSGEPRHRFLASVQSCPSNHGSGRCKFGHRRPWNSSDECTLITDAATRLQLDRVHDWIRIGVGFDCVFTLEPPRPYTACMRHIANLFCPALHSPDHHPPCQ